MAVSSWKHEKTSSILTLYTFAKKILKPKAEDPNTTATILRRLTTARVLCKNLSIFHQENDLFHTVRKLNQLFYLLNFSSLMKISFWSAWWIFIERFCTSKFYVKKIFCSMSILKGSIWFVELIFPVPLCLVTSSHCLILLEVHIMCR